MRGFYRKGGYYGRYNRQTRGRGELKFFDGLKDETNILAAGLRLDLTLLTIPEGVGESARIGRKITLTKLSWRAELELKPTADSSSNTFDCIRIMIVQDTQANGAAPNFLDVLEVADVDSFRNMSFSRRFRMLYDRKLVINSNGAINTTTPSALNKVVRLVVNIPLQMTILYNKDLQTGVLSTIESNNIMIMAISQKGLVDIQYRWRVRYHE